MGFMCFPTPGDCFGWFATLLILIIVTINMILLAILVDDDDVSSIKDLIKNAISG